MRPTASALLITAVAASCAFAAQPSTTGDWPDFLGPHRDGHADVTGIRTDWPLPIVWQTEIGVSYTAPTVASERLFEYGRYDKLVKLNCRNADTGQLLWTKSHKTAYTDMLGYNNGPRSTPVVNGGCVYTMSAEGLLQCRKVEDGALVWENETSETFGVVTNFFGVGSTPIVAGDLVIANIGGSPAGQPPDVYSANGNVAANGTGVVAFDKQTGKVEWKAGDELASYASPTVATIDGVELVLVFARGGLIAVRIDDGQVAFEFPYRSALLESVNASTPIVVGNKVFLSETYELGSTLLEVDQNSAQVVWSDKQRGRDMAMQLHWNTPVYHDGYLYGSSGRHSGAAELRCVDFRTGKVAWSERGLGRCSLTYADDHLVCLGEDGNVRLIKATPDAFAEVARMDPAGADGSPLITPDAWVAPVIAGGKLYLRGADRLVCFQLVKNAQE